LTAEPLAITVPFVFTADSAGKSGTVEYLLQVKVRDNAGADTWANVQPLRLVLNWSVTSATPTPTATMTRTPKPTVTPTPECAELGTITLVGSDPAPEAAGSVTLRWRYDGEALPSDYKYEVVFVYSDGNEMTRGFDWQKGDGAGNWTVIISQLNDLIRAGDSELLKWDIRIVGPNACKKESTGSQQITLRRESEDQAKPTPKD
jgi:hypothetical protein